MRTDCPDRDCLREHTSRRPAFVHEPVGNTPQKIEIEIPRWLAACGREILPNLPHSGISPNHKMTLTAVDFAVAELQDGRPPKHIARSLVVSENTIRHIKREHIAAPTIIP